MKTNMIILVLAFAHLCCGQGSFLPNNPFAPTRIGTPTGPFAGPGFWAQFLVSTNTESLTPVGNPLEHFPSGYVAGDIVTIPGIPGDTYEFIQMVAWDGTRWGTSLSGVPSDQLGRTDIVQHFFTFEFQPQSPPLFNQSAVVPVPEPSALALGALAVCALWLTFRSRRAFP